MVASDVSDRVLTIGCTTAAPIIVASRTTSSILSPLSTLMASVTRTAGSGAGGDGSEDRQADGIARERGDRGAIHAAAPVEHVDLRRPRPAAAPAQVARFVVSKGSTPDC